MDELTRSEVEPPAGLRELRSRARDRLTGAVRTGLGRVLLDPVREGRIRDVGWPVGLRAVVALAGLAYAGGALLVVGAGPIRAHAVLAAAPGDLTTVPRAWVWPVLAVVLVALALFQCAVLHVARWLRLLGTLVTLLVMGSWGLRHAASTTGLVGTTGLAATAVCMVGLVVLIVLRARHPFAWWEFGATWLLVGLPVVLGVLVLNRSARPFGFDLVPVYLQSTVDSLGPVAIPAAVAAGLSVAEITVSATLRATRLTARFASARTTYAALAVLLLVRVVQAAWRWAQQAPLQRDVGVLCTWLLLLGFLAGGSALVLRAGGGRPVDVPALPERMSTMALPLALALAGFSLVSVLALTLLGIAGDLAPGAVGGWSTGWLDRATSPTVAAGYRLAVAVGLGAVAARAARRGSSDVGLLLTAVGVTLGATALRPLTSGVLDPGPGSDPADLVATLVIVAVLAVLLVRRTLTPNRAAALSGALVLTILLGYRDVVADPLGVLLGGGGVALALFGLTWSLFTDSGFANEGTPAYPVPARVLLALANSTLALAVLGYTRLVRDPGAAVDLGGFAQLGDQVLGTALLAAAFVATLSAVRAGGGSTSAAGAEVGVTGSVPPAGPG